jgi:nitrogen regulatory protein P-II 1
MKLIVAIIRSEQTNDVLALLYKANIKGLTISNVHGHGGETDTVQTYRGTTVMIGMSDKVRFEIAVSDSFVQPAIDAIIKGARTGEVGDGKIFVLPVEKIYRIRTGEEDLQAVTPVNEKPGDF